MTPHVLTTCPTPDKLAFTDRVAAVRELAYCIAANREERRVYRCRCGRYHLTRREGWRELLLDQKI